MFFFVNIRHKSRIKKLIFSESDQLDVLKAAQICKEDGIVEPILMGRKKVIKKLMKSIDFNDKVKIIDPKDKSQKKIPRKHINM